MIGDGEPDGLHCHGVLERVEITDTAGNPVKLDQLREQPGDDEPAGQPEPAAG
jgi:hypothetical protein